MALLATQSPSLAGLNVTFAAATAGGDTVAPDERTHLHVKNGSAGALTVTVVAKTTCSQGVLHDAAVSVPAGGERKIGPITPQRFARPSDGLAEITYSGVTSLTIAAIRG